jgi:hypothetical protein
MTGKHIGTTLAQPSVLRGAAVAAVVTVFGLFSRGAGTLPGDNIHTEHALNGLVSDEILRRSQALKKAIQGLAAQRRRWPEGT